MRHTTLLHNGVGVRRRGVRRGVKSALDSYEFRARVKSRLDPALSKTLAPDSETIIETICRFYKIHRDKLFTVKRGTENEPRHVAIYLIRTIRAEPLLKIGALFNLNKHSSVSSAVERIKNRLGKDRKFQKRFDKINNMSYKGQSET